MAPNRMQLQSLSRKSSESFKEYGQWWKELAARAQPPLLDKELIDIFIDTLHVSYLERMVGIMLSSFSDLVIVGEHIKSILKSGKNQDSSSSQASESESLEHSQKEEEDKTNAVIANVEHSHGAPAKPYGPSTSR